MEEAFARLDACGADAELVALARHCLAPQRDGRPANARAVAEAVAAYRAGVEARLQRAETERAAQEARAAEEAKRRRVVLLAGGALAGVLLAGIVGTTLGLVEAWRQSAQKEA